MINHTDRELLELAARAAEIQDFAWCEPIYNISDTPESGLIKHGGVWDYKNPVWNPLENDGDAFRLMCQLSMRVYVYNGGGDDYTVAATDELRPSKIVTQVPHNNGVYEATRRAIVLAAAEIGAAL